MGRRQGELDVILIGLELVGPRKVFQGRLQRPDIQLPDSVFIVVVRRFQFGAGRVKPLFADAKMDSRAGSHLQDRTFGYLLEQLGGLFITLFLEKPEGGFIVLDALGQLLVDPLFFCHVFFNASSLLPWARMARI